MNIEKIFENGLKNAYCDVINKINTMIKLDITLSKEQIEILETLKLSIEKQIEEL